LSGRLALANATEDVGITDIVETRTHCAMSTDLRK
jgi:hypothetical protein